MDGFYAPPSTPVVDIPSDESNIRLAYELTYWDYYLFNCMHQFFLVALQACNILAALFGGWVMGRSHGGATGITLALLIYTVLWLLQYGFNLLLLFSKKNRSLFTTHVVEIREVGLYEETKYSRSLHFWNGGLAKVVSRPGFVAVYTAAHLAHIIPARAFANRAHREGFKATIERRMNDGP